MELKHIINDYSKVNQLSINRTKVELKRDIDRNFKLTNDYQSYQSGIETRERRYIQDAGLLLSIVPKWN